MLQVRQVSVHPVAAISARLVIGFVALRDSQTHESLLSFSFKQGIETDGPILILTGAGADSVSSSGNRDWRGSFNSGIFPKMREF